LIVGQLRRQTGRNQTNDAFAAHIKTVTASCNLYPKRASAPKVGLVVGISGHFYWALSHSSGLPLASSTLHSNPGLFGRAIEHILRTWPTNPSGSSMNFTAEFAYYGND
jgi:hypothetical protein